MRKPKKSAGRQPPSAWEVYRLKSSPAAFIGAMYAKAKDSAAALMPDRRFRPSDGLRGLARRYMDTTAARALGAFLAVVVVVVLAGLAWLWRFGA